MNWLKSPCTMCWLVVLSIVCRNAAICVRMVWLRFARVLSMWMVVKSTVVCPLSLALCSFARTVRACQPMFADFVSGVYDMV